MSTKSRLVFFVCFAIIPFFFLTACYARPPKPGPNFVWVKPHKNPTGVGIPGHWKYTGPARKGMLFCKYEKEPKLLSPKPGAVWVPGHHGPRGRWVRGHWR